MPLYYKIATSKHVQYCYTALNRMEMNEVKYEERMKEVIRERWNRSAHKYDNSPGHGIHSEEEKEAWKNLLTRWNSTRETTAW